MRADVIPQLADGAEVLERIEVPDDVSLSVLIPNERGLENALALRDRFHEVNVFLSASESHNRANVNRSIEESLTGLERVLGRARAEGLRCEGVISVAFGCPYEGHVPPERVFAIARRLIAAGAQEIGFGDTTGMANPAQVREFFPAARAALGDEVELTAHFHNTRGQGLANVLAAFDAGVRSFESSFGELGGCPVPRGATGNIATEDLVSMLHEMGDGDRRLARAAARGGARGAGGARPAARLARAHRRAGPVELAPLTTLRLGGPAGSFVEARTEDEVVEAARGAALVLAGGSNVVIADDGVPGTVARIATRGVERDGTRLTVAAGEDWDALVAACVAEGLQGFECLSGIPGSVGATPIQNVGAYGQEVAETVESVRVFDRETGRVENMTAADCGFVYRGSVFKYHDRRVVLSVTFRLREAPSPARCATPSSRARSTSRSAAARRWPTCARPCSRCGAARGWSSTPPTPTRSAPARSSPTRSSLPAPMTRCASTPRRSAAGLARARRPDQDLGRVADRAGRLPAGLRQRPRRDLDQAHARARQPRRRHHRRADGARARDRRRRPGAVRRRPAPRAGARGARLVAAAKRCWMRAWGGGRSASCPPGAALAGSRSSAPGGHAAARHGH